jgi:zinc protease
MKTICSLLALVFASTSLLGAEPALEALKPTIPFKKFVLKNGLTLIVHEDHKAPIVAVNLWYHVGSKNEKRGKTGFAHLFEHMMFTGSEHFQASGNQRAFFEAMEQIGATDLNGTTSADRTDFFENVPTNALDIALWIESDRMGHLLNAVDQKRLDEQRGVVQNEKRQGENQPYGLTDELIVKGTAPTEHPYSWTVIGSMDDLNAASLEDVKEWFRAYYGAANTVIVLSGDITPEAALKKVEHYFGEIPSGQPVAHFEKWIPEILGTRRQNVEDRVPQARIYKVWNVPGYGEAEATYLELVGRILSSGKSSRLYKRLVYDQQIATDVSAYVEEGEISQKFYIVATARPGEDLAKIEQGIDEEVGKLIAEGPTEEELSRAKMNYLAAFSRLLERVGGFNGKSDILAQGQTYRGTPDFYQTLLRYVREATGESLRTAAEEWLTENVYILNVRPFGSFETTESKVDRSKPPAPGDFPNGKFPKFQRTQLSNGLKIVLAERHATPTVNLSLQVDAGYAADQFGRPGTARLASSMIDEGTKKRTSLQISDELESIGADLAGGSDLDSTRVNLSALSPTLDRALDIYADVILNASFPEADFQRLKSQLLAGIQRERAEPITMALRVFPKLLYGPQHAYGNPLTGSGTEASVSQITRDDVEKFHATWFKPNNASLVVVGDTTMDQIKPKLEKLFGGWKGGEVPKKNITAAARQTKPLIYLIDRPDSIQSIVLAGHVAPPKANPDEIAIETMNTVLGGTFTSRINMNLREDKHWAYGAFTFLWDARGERPFIAYAPVQSDKTKEAMKEVDSEIRGFLGDKPISADELANAQKNQTLSLPGYWETNDRVVGSLDEIERFGLPDDYFDTYSTKVRALTLPQTMEIAKKVVHPEQLTWVIVGDRSKIEAEIRSLNWGEIKLLDADGNPAK